MSSKLIPAKPEEVLVVREVTANVTTLSVPFARFGVLEVGGRCTIVRMTSGGVMVFSPTALTTEAKAVVQRLGGSEGVKYLVAPDMEHHIFLSEWAQTYPQARIVAPAGLPEKRAATGGKDAKINVDDIFFKVLQDGSKTLQQTVAPDFDADFELVYLDTHINKEVVLLYRHDGGVLIEADLLFNLPAIEQYARVDPATRRGGPDHPDLLNSIFQWLMTAQGDHVLASQRFQWYVASRRNRGRYNEALRIIDSWTFDTLIPCHGETVVGQGKAAFRKVFAWHLEDKRD